MIEFADIIVDLQAGDTGKGKIANFLTENDYTHVIRYNGGGNAGHTFYHNDKKIVTHSIPVGVIYNKMSIIGPGCVVNVKSILNEIEYLENLGYNVKEYLKIDKRVHIITEDNINEDANDIKIGTTKTGNGPTYRNKYSRTGIRAESIPELKQYLCDIYDELHAKGPVKVLFEGAQGFELDIDWGDYPYVTSSSCTVGSAINNGVPPQKIRRIWGISKAYRTYVGNKKFEPEDDAVFNLIREKYNEFGATTGRPRQINYLDLNSLIIAANINGVTDLVINKFDALKDLGIFKLYYKSKLMEFIDANSFEKFIIDVLNNNCCTIVKIYFSESAHTL
jgi:adenylosuccinate synthase